MYCVLMIALSLNQFIFIFFGAKMCGSDYSLNALC